ncbi:alkanesulfonate monooxygenase SsuD/methylene tetrahydromethanopterin reductase-like flavin-dependent oxidoreductase (luciferase family) [Rhodococcus sp. 27YEA15]|uniref:LLM class flavin-dependent oxidoreductase n=1 Tax=Rhodococcus sp. 27YEA15 TaxID=3156259 RepID=UPI003C7DA45F
MTVFAVGIELDGEGTHPSAWRRSAYSPDQLLTGKTIRLRVAAAENAGFTFATFDDSILPPTGEVRGRIDAVARASYVAPVTSTIGLVPVVGTSYAEPFHTSSQLATLDYSSRGRGGWLPVPVADPAAAKTWGRPAVTTDADRAREQHDSVTVVRELWDSWEDDAVVRHYATGRFLDRDRLHYIDFEGKTFSVKGPAIVPRPPQGQLVVFGRYGQIDPRQADVVLVTGDSVESIAAAAVAARNEGALLVVAELDVALDTPASVASERLADLNSHVEARESGRFGFSGDPLRLAALLGELGSHVDGVHLHPLVLDEELPVLAKLVLPELSKSGLTRRPVPGSSLRANLGLARPANRFAHTS